MNKLRRFVMWFALILIVLLAVLSVVGAFYGAEKASQFFNSLPLTIYWLTLTVFLVAGLVTFRRLIRVPGLLLIHLGCVFILVGAIWGSEDGHRFQKRFFGIDKVPFGYMMIYEQTAESNIVAEDDKVLAKLPFSIYLEDFRIEYYKSQSYLQVENKNGDIRQIPDDLDQELSLNESKIKILRVFRNFKIAIIDGKKIATDSTEPGINPAIEINIELSDGSSKQQYIFAQFPQDAYSDAGLKFTYVSQMQAPVKDYFSDVILLEGEKQTAKKTIEVNHPLHYGGYHFYQHSYDPEKGRYTILTVYSDSGLNLVYAGYLMLCSGVLWQFWCRHFLKFFKRSRNGD
ncbi:MAG: cytochrome c biogenesis protein ResB [Planctomycetes bacterium]|nr:cytochrome c biogenesis protein ResB [Planctomycetota bacterium]